MLITANTRKVGEIGQESGRPVTMWVGSDVSGREWFYSAHRAGRGGGSNIAGTAANEALALAAVEAAAWSMGPFTSPLGSL